MCALCVAIKYSYEVAFMHYPTVVWKRCRDEALPIRWPLLSCNDCGLWFGNKTTYAHAYVRKWRPTRQQLCRAENSFIDWDEFIALKTLSGRKALRCDKHQFRDKWRWVLEPFSRYCCLPAIFTFSCLPHDFWAVTWVLLIIKAHSKRKRIPNWACVACHGNKNAYIRESVDSLCRDGTDAQCMQYLTKSPITSPQIIYAKYLFKHPASHTLSTLAIPYVIGTSPGSVHIPDLCCDNGKWWAQYPVIYAIYLYLNCCNSFSSYRISLASERRKEGKKEVRR